MNPILFSIFLQIFLIFLNAIFACAEIAIVSMNDNRLALLVSHGDKRALRLHRLTSHPAQFLATIQIAITLSGFLGSAFAADHFSDPLVDLLLGAGVPISAKTLDTLAVIVITLILSYFTLVFGELVPKRLGMKQAETLALSLSGLISAISKIFAPVVAVLTVSTNLILRLMGIDPNEDEEGVSEEEIRMMLDRGSETGVFDSDTKEFIQNVFEFDDLTAGEFATHRTELDFLWTDQTLEEWTQLILSTRHTLYPLCEDTVDHVVGILDARELLRLQNSTKEEILQRAVQPAFFVPETVKADVLFKEMKRHKNYFSVVLDEYGGMLGVVTIRDLMEQLVGDIWEDDEMADIVSIDEKTWRIRGSADLEDVSHDIGVKLPLDEYETFGGYVFGLYGSIPPDGRSFTLRADRLNIHVNLIQDHKLQEATVTILPQNQEEKE